MKAFDETALWHCDGTVLDGVALLQSGADDQCSIISAEFQATQNAHYRHMTQDRKRQASARMWFMDACGWELEA